MGRCGGKCGVRICGGLQHLGGMRLGGGCAWRGFGLWGKACGLVHRVSVAAFISAAANVAAWEQPKVCSYGASQAQQLHCI